MGARCAVRAALVTVGIVLLGADADAARPPVVVVAVDGVAVDANRLGDASFAEDTRQALHEAGWAAGGVRHEEAAGHLHTLVAVGHHPSSPADPAALWHAAQDHGLRAAVRSWPAPPAAAAHLHPATDAAIDAHPTTLEDAIAHLITLFAPADPAQHPHLTMVHARAGDARLPAILNAIRRAVPAHTNVVLVSAPQQPSPPVPACTPGDTAAVDNCDVCDCREHGGWACPKGRRGCGDTAATTPRAPRIGDECRGPSTSASDIAVITHSPDCPEGAECRPRTRGAGSAGGEAVWTCQSPLARGGLGLLAAIGPAFRQRMYTAFAVGGRDVYAFVRELLGVPPPQEAEAAASNAALRAAFRPIMKRSVSRARWGAPWVGDSPYAGEWYPQQDAMTVYPPSANFSKGTRFDLAVIVPAGLVGGDGTWLPEVTVYAVDVGEAQEKRLPVAAMCTGAHDIMDHTVGAPAAAGQAADGGIGGGYTQHVYRTCSLHKDWRRVRVAATQGRQTTSVEYGNVLLPPGGAKNVILVVGDGMSLPMITATRLLTRGRLPTDDFDHNGVAFTKSLESIVTDSAAAATALNTGHKTFNGGLGVYPDAAQGTPFTAADNPRVETFAEYVRRTKNMRVGVVTTASLVDATPAGVWAHHARRDAGVAIAEQALDMQPEVMLGGGTEVFQELSPSAAGSGAHPPRIVDRFTAAGYTVATTAEALTAAVNASTRAAPSPSSPPTPKLLGLFAPNHLHTANDRRADANNTQPSLPAMATAALSLLDRGDDPRGFYLMVEAASIDKQAHGCDYARMLGDSLELQETLAAVGRELGRRGLAEETLVVVTSDHATGGYDVYGTVDTDGVRSVGPTVDYNAEIQMYGQAEWPDWEARDFRVGNWETAQWTFAGVNNNHPSYREDFRPKPRAGWLGKAGEQRQLDGIELSNNLGETEHFEAVHASVHTSSDVMVFANGRGGAAFAGAYENTDVFHKMVAALEPAKRGEPALEALHQAVDVLEANVMRLAALVGEELALPAGKPATPHAAAARLQLLQDHFDRQTQQLHSKILSAEGGHGPGGFEAYPSAHHVPWPDMALAFLILGLLTAYFCTGLFGTVVALFVYTCSCWPWVRRGYSKVDEEEGAGEGVGLAASSSGQPQESLAQRRPQAGYGTGV